MKSPVRWTPARSARLGTESDGAIARSLKFHEYVVCGKRWELGIPSRRVAKWTPESIEQGVFAAVQRCRGDIQASASWRTSGCLIAPSNTSDRKDPLVTDQAECFVGEVGVLFKDHGRILRMISQRAKSYFV